MGLQLAAAATVIILLGLLLAIIGNGFLGAAIWRSGTLPRWAGIIWAAATLIFYLLGAALGMATGSAVTGSPGG